MDKITEEIQNEMKSMIAGKTKCMIESYAGVLANTKKALEAERGSMIKDDEIMKRADMFWNIALQKIDQDKRPTQNQGKQRPQPRPNNGMNPMPKNDGQESPCAKKSRQAAEKIATLEAQIIESKVIEDK